ncbi:hypothetical protein KCP75_05770 [Salmonella enterica subsp. enterica]|nr:hypothetical protein KCP75_05770 [Salmonella enterica subsp. enterica]
MRGVRAGNGNYPFTLNIHHWDRVKASQDRLSPVRWQTGTLLTRFFWTDDNT